jgi:integrase
MPKLKLDSTQCLIASCPEGKTKEVFWDTAITGFTLEVRPNGGKTYYLRYWDQDERQRQVKLGGYSDITCEQARKKAQRLRSEVTLGGDPAAKKDERKAVPTYSELAKQHLAHAESYQRSYDDIEAIMRLHLLPRWGKLKLHEIKQQEIAKWLGQKRSDGLAPATVEKIRVTFNRSFELAARWSIPGGHVNPVRGIPRPKFDNKRQRYLTAAEAERLHKAVAASPNRQLKYIVGLLLLTGARKMELLKAKWEHIDLERKSWLIPDSKTGKARHVPLSQAAIGIIEQLPKYEKCPWLLPNPETKEPFVDIKRAWATARKAAGLQGLRIHDLRHSAASFLVNAGVDLFAVGRILGHSDVQSSRRYAHLANDTLLRAVEAGAAGLKVNWASPRGNAHGL